MLDLAVRGLRDSLQAFNKLYYLDQAQRAEQKAQAEKPAPEQMSILARRRAEKSKPKETKKEPWVYLFWS